MKRIILLTVLPLCMIGAILLELLERTADAFERWLDAPPECKR